LYHWCHTPIFSDHRAQPALHSFPTRRSSDLGKPMATSQDFATWTCTEALEPKYLMYAIMAEGDEIRRFGKGTTHTTIYFPEIRADRKSTRLNSSHVKISYAVFCLKQKKELAN